MPTQAVDINPGATGSSPVNLTVFNNRIYFAANGSVAAGTEFWSFDGTTELRNLTLRGGRAANNGTTTAAALGGAILFGDAVAGAVTGSTINANTATGGAGGTGGDRGPQPGGPYATGGEGGGVAVIAGTGAVDLLAGLVSADQSTGAAGGAGGSGTGFGYPSGAAGANASGEGGGVAIVSGALRLANATISSNTAGGANIVSNRGGGVFTTGGSLGVTNSTVTLNTAFVSNGVALTGAVAFNVANSIIAGNNLFNDVTGAFTSVKNSILGSATGATGITNGTNGNLVGVDPKLGALINNGGQTLAHALLPGSPALDAGDNASATAAGLTTDGRGVGFARTLDSADAGTVDVVDIGTLEASPTTADIANDSTYEDVPRLLNFGFGDGDLVNTFSAASTNTALVPNANLVINCGAASVGNLTITPLANQSGTTTVTVTITGENGQTATDSFVFTVTPVNDAPEFTSGGNHTVFEDAGVQTVTGWAIGVRPGPASATDEATQTVAFETEVTGTTGGLTFGTAPSVSPNGTLTYTSTPNSFGTGTVRVRLAGNGINTPMPNVNDSAYQTFAITVNPVNDAPTLNVIANPAAILEDAGLQMIALAGIGAGPLETQG